MKQVLADSGYLVALGIRRDPRHQAAKAFLAAYKGEIVVPGPVVVESCYFLSTAAKTRLLDWLAKDHSKVVELPSDASAGIAMIIARYAGLKPDFVDGAIVWLADHIGCPAILTIDTRDFGIYRLKGGKRFEVIRWFD